MGGLFLGPGLIDIHCHGGYGYDVMDNQEDVLDKISKYKLKKWCNRLAGYTINCPPLKSLNLPVKE